MTSNDETKALRDEIAELRAEVERLLAWKSAHVCAQPAMEPLPPAAIPCTCGETQGCRLHPWQWRGNVWANTGCAGGFTGQILTVLPGNSTRIDWLPTAGAAGVPPTFIYNTAAGQYP